MPTEAEHYLRLLRHVGELAAQITSALRALPSAPATPEPPHSPTADLLEFAWGIIANAGGGNWDRETDEWRESAVRFRERWFVLIGTARMDPAPEAHICNKCKKPYVPGTLCFPVPDATPETKE
jgi:hypothetical protein